MAEHTPGESEEPALPAGSEFEGVLLASGPARIEGRVRGQVIGTASLEIGAAATVEGPVEAPEVRVAGRVTGDVIASRRIELAGTASIEGRIEAPALAAADGARVEGQARVGPGRKPAEGPPES